MELTITKIEFTTNANGDNSYSVEYDILDGEVVENKLGYQFPANVTVKEINDTLKGLIDKKKVSKSNTPNQNILDMVGKVYKN